MPMGPEAEVFPDMAHDMMLEPNWKQVAERIVDWLQERGLWTVEPGVVSDESRLHFGRSMQRSRHYSPCPIGPASAPAVEPHNR